MSESSKIITAVVLLMAVICLDPPGAGVQGRPPASTDRVLVGALDPAQINGLVFISGSSSSLGSAFFGLRVLVYRQGASLEEAPSVFDLGPHAADGSYAAVSWRTQLDEKTPITFRWSRLNQTTVIGRISAPPGVRIAMEAYRPWRSVGSDESWATFWAQADRRTVLGEQVQTQAGASPLRRFLLRTDRTAIGAASYEDASAMRKMLVKEGHAQQPDQSDKPSVYHQAALSFDLSMDSSIGFIAMIGESFDSMEREAEKLLPGSIADSLDLAEKNYQATRTLSAGAIGASLDLLSRVVNWNRYYQPEKQLEYLAIHRQSGAPEDQREGGPVLSWESFLTATMAAPIDPGSATATIRTLLETQTPDGRVPLRRHMQSQSRSEPVSLTGRSMPPVGAMAIWKVYLETYDLGLLAWAYPRLLQWNDWWSKNRGDGQSWRDGNGDGLLEWGFDAELEQGALGARMLPNSTKLRLAFSESGLDDRPQWSNGEDLKPPSGGATNRQHDVARYNDATHTLEFSPVALNSLYALDTEILSIMARELGLPTEADRLRIRYERIKALINNRLWSEEDGLYLNRHWDGRFSRRLSPENFYPLIAGVVEEERAKKVVATLRDGRKFWGDQPLASIARDDPAFTPQGPGRGAVWSLMNYLVYLGLRRYNFHDEAAELSRHCTRLARAASEKSGRLYGHYSSLDGRPVVESDQSVRASFPGLMFFPGIEELISADIWGGMAFGSLSATEESRIERVTFAGSSLDAIFGPERLVIRRGGKIEIECEGAVRLRGYRATDNAIGFTIDTKDRVRLLLPAIEGRKLTVSVDNKVLGSTSIGAAASFRVPAGSHKVFIVK